MNGLKTSTIFFLLAIDGLRVDESSDARNAVIRAYHGAVSLEAGEKPEVVITRAGRLFRRTIAAEERKALEETSGLLSTVDSLKMLTMEGLFGHSREKVYVANSDIFREASAWITDSVEKGNVGKETAMLIWLLREAGCLPEFLSVDELERLGDIEGIKEFPLWPEFIGKKLELGEKRRIDSYPECERLESIFMENILFKGDDRLKALIEYIEKGNHTVEAIGNDLRIDNRLYSVNMDAVLRDRIERRGVNLQPLIGDRS